MSKVEVAPLGITVREIDATTAESLGYGPGRSGLLVTNVDREGLAFGYLEAFDLVDQVERKAVGSASAFATEIAARDLSEGVLLRFYRRGTRRAVKRLVLILP